MYINECLSLSRFLFFYFLFLCVRVIIDQYVWMMMRVCMCVRKRERVYYANKCVIFVAVFVLFFCWCFFTLEGHIVN